MTTRFEKITDLLKNLRPRGLRSSIMDSQVSMQSSIMAAWYPRVYVYYLQRIKTESLSPHKVRGDCPLTSKKQNALNNLVKFGMPPKVVPKARKELQVGTRSVPR